MTFDFPPSIHLITQAGKPVVKVIRTERDTLATIAQTMGLLERALNCADSELLLIDGSRIDLSHATVVDMDSLAMRFIAAVPSCRRMAIASDSIPDHVAAHYTKLCQWKQIRVKYFAQVEDALTWLV